MLINHTINARKIELFLSLATKLFPSSSTTFQNASSQSSVSRDEIIFMADSDHDEADVSQLRSLTRGSLVSTDDGLEGSPRSHSHYQKKMRIENRKGTSHQGSSSTEVQHGHLQRQTVNDDAQKKKLYNKIIKRTLARYMQQATARKSTHQQDSGHAKSAASMHDVACRVAATKPVKSNTQKLPPYQNTSTQIRALTMAAVSPSNRAGLMVLTPSVSDVLFGRGRRQREHSGNIYMKEICDKNRAVYDLADREDKTKMTRSIVNTIQAYGGRFLRFDKQQKMWITVSDEDARQKVAHVMRDGRANGMDYNDDVYSGNHDG